MSSLTADSVKLALSTVSDPQSGRDVMSAGMISGVVVREGKVGFVLTIDTAFKDDMARLREQCEAAVTKLPGVVSVTAVMTAQASGKIPPKPEAGYSQPRDRAVWNLTPVENVFKVIAVASGKGGVGKSTTALNLALALAKAGKRVGLLDADIYGPSLPRMLGLSGQPPIVEGKMVPPAAHGVECMSMGFITGEEAAMLRGPMISKTLHQLLRFTRWGQHGKLDLLLVDMPPGTGDIHLSMMQQVPMAGAVIVTTPQEVAVMDARKCMKMFMKLNVPVLGVVENMSYFVEPATGKQIALFGEGGGRKLAQEAGVAFLGEVPIDPFIGQSAEEAHVYDGAYASAYATIAEALL